MISLLSIILLFLIFIAAIIDIRYKQIPAIFLTGLLFAILMIQFITFENGILHLVLGIFSFIFAFLLYEGKFIGGVADIKLITIIGIMLKSNIYLYAFILIILLIGFIYKLYFIYIAKKEQTEEVPYIPLIFIVYVVMMIIGGIV